MSPGIPNAPPAVSVRSPTPRRTGCEIGPGGHVSAEVALRLMPVVGAWRTGEEGFMGSLTPGFYADLAMLSDNLLTIPADGLADIACVAAMVGGRWVPGGLDGPR